MPLQIPEPFQSNGFGMPVEKNSVNRSGQDVLRIKHLRGAALESMAWNGKAHHHGTPVPIAGMQIARRDDLC
jgi:hypothetical protein